MRTNEIIKHIIKKVYAITTNNGDRPYKHNDHPFITDNKILADLCQEYGFRVTHNIPNDNYIIRR